MPLKATRVLEEIQGSIKTLAALDLFQASIKNAHWYVTSVPSDIVRSR